MTKKKSNENWNYLRMGQAQRGFWFILHVCNRIFFPPIYFLCGSLWVHLVPYYTFYSVEQIVYETITSFFFSEVSTRGTSIFTSFFFSHRFFFLKMCLCTRDLHASLIWLVGCPPPPGTAGHTIGTLFTRGLCISTLFCFLLDTKTRCTALRKRQLRAGTTLRGS